MEQKYKEWINSYVASRPRYANTGEPSLRGMCVEATSEMVAAFPELTRVRGFVRPGGQHWWCVDPNGNIVDPTVLQFPRPPREYEPFDESKADQLPTGKCPNCGDHLFYKAQVCDEECARSLFAYFDLSGEALEEAVKKAKFNPPDDDPNFPCMWWL